MNMQDRDIALELLRRRFGKKVNAVFSAVMKAPRDKTFDYFISIEDEIRVKGHSRRSWVAAARDAIANHDRQQRNGSDTFLAVAK